MTTRNRRWQKVTALAVTALGVASLAIFTGSGSANADPTRTALTSTDTTYLSDTLGLPANTVVETVTYDRFQWLLQQPGKYAFLIGDPAEDANFATEAQAVDAAARSAGASKVYWFDPNLSGSVKIGSAAVPNLDIRNPSGITTLAAASQTIYGEAWLNLIGQYLGNGIKATPSGVGTENATVAVADDSTVVNDANAPLYDYTSGTPADAADSVFFIYDKSNTFGSPARPDKLVRSVDLNTDASYAADVAASLSAVGGANISSIGQFAWLKSEFNSKAAAQDKAQSGNPNQYGGPVLDDSDDATPFAVQQITFPELVHLLNLKASAGQNFVILFGGTWCPNTRAVIKYVNAQAQANGVTVYNFDTVLDGGTVGGGTTSASNPLQSRNTANSGSTTNANPSYLYGSLVSTYLKNIVTQYDLNNGTYVTYYPNGVTTSSLQAVRKLQVPFLIDYQRGTGTNPSSTSIKRQWIQQRTDPSTGLPSYTEYMTEWYFSDAKPGDTRLGLSSSQFPVSLPIPGLSGFNWESPTYPDTSTNSDDDAYLDPADATASQQPAALDAALAALPASVNVASVADAASALAAAQSAAPVDSTLVSNLTTIKADWTLAQTRKSTVSNALANVVFAQEAVDKLGTFFGGLPGAVATTQTVSAPAVVEGSTPTIEITVANDVGRSPTGNVSLVINGATYGQPVVGGEAWFTLPQLTADVYPFTLSYPGDDQIEGFSKNGTLVVNPAPKPVTGSGGTAAGTATVPAQTATTTATGSTASFTPANAGYKVTVSTVTPTTTSPGRYRIAVVTPSGDAKATGKVTVKLKKGSTSKTLTGSLSSGAVTISVPKLQAGVWAVTITYLGNTNYKSASTTGSLVVGKARVTKVIGSFTSRPTTTSRGKYEVRVATLPGKAAATGTVTVKVKKGSTTKTLTGALSRGSITALVPKLSKGTWSISILWPGDANYQGASIRSSLAVTR